MDTLGRGQFEIAHDVDKFLQAFVETEARIMRHLFSNGGATTSLVIMAGINNGVTWKRKQLLPDRLV